jgi:Ni2+-binding GTPase involved in maturation of urease and hydrogenase
MKIVTIAGLPCAGKTLVIAHLIRSFMSFGLKAAAARFDILPSVDGTFYDKGFETAPMKSSCNFICPGFCCLSTLKDVFKWGRLRKVDVLFIEIAIFCCSWIPRIKNVPVIIVMDNLRGMYSQGKMRCLLSLADTVVITKTDLVCRVETEMFQSKIRLVQPNASIVNFNGLNGKGALTLKRIIDDFKETDEISEKQLCCSSHV